MSNATTTASVVEMIEAWTADVDTVDVDRLWHATRADLVLEAELDRVHRARRARAEQGDAFAGIRRW